MRKSGNHEDGVECGHELERLGLDRRRPAANTYALHMASQTASERDADEDEISANEPTGVPARNLRAIPEGAMPDSARISASAAAMTVAA